MLNYFLGLILILLLTYIYKSSFEKFRVYYNTKSKLHNTFYERNEKLFNSSTAAFILFNGNMQTIFIGIIDAILHALNKMGVSPYRFFYNRSIYNLQDGGKIAIDNAVFTDKTKSSNSEKYDKILIIPGFTSYSEDFYIKDLISKLIDSYDVSVVTARGFGGIDLHNHIMISSYMENDLADFITHYCEENSKSQVFIIGFSFGGMMLSKYLCNKKNVHPKNLHAVCAISYPICVKKTADYTENILWGLYSWASCLNLRKCFFDNMEVIFQDPRLRERKDEIVNEVKQAKWSSNFDKAYTYKALGLESIDQYYDDIRLNDKDFLNIRLPFLTIYAEDDPVVPISSVPIDTFKKNKNIIAIIAKSGGHNAFFSGFLPRRWIDKPIKDFFEINKGKKE